MSKRIHQLEVALQSEHTSHSTHAVAHPLLSDDLLDIKNGIFLFENPERAGADPDNSWTFQPSETAPRNRSSSDEEHSWSSKGDGYADGLRSVQKHEDEEEEEDIVGSLGILSVNESGETRFVGQSGFQVGIIDE